MSKGKLSPICAPTSKQRKANNMLEQMLARYNALSDDDRYNAMREIMQEIALAGLYRGGFFKKAAFYGGTALRIFYGLDRYSEDLDFSLLGVDEGFSLAPYFEAIVSEFEALGIKIEISQKEKSTDTNIESAFLKNDTAIHILSLSSKAITRPIKIKFEVDKKPPLGFETEEKLLLQPFSFYVKCFCVGDLYAGKMHALLFRSWRQRVKGRDWYDFEWYVRNSHRLNLEHLSIRAIESGHLAFGEIFDRDTLIKALLEKIDTLDIEAAKLDIRRFIKNDRALNIWSKEYFEELVKRIAIKEF